MTVYVTGHQPPDVNYIRVLAKKYFPCRVNAELLPLHTTLAGGSPGERAARHSGAVQP